ncbi:hypothetical protein DLAC_07869 [Tieghemostelium lacteum]|uniref:THH1/TOM1/TOM3 domain-containing protein n=1 Tax=Tieghemostelium lacteum TaxID=361077 RepID=A0A151ZAK9_TIELA|nr:hypothetical protein DLAC_07869 [Tieghemostelium lacteum]|eukprot:KYQ90980.1 hypothetical protein DLAC_07869 [Tieghemostelium lacteum]
MRNKYSLLVLLLLYLLSNELRVFGFNLQSGSILEKQANVLGVELNYALIDLEFDRELYRYRSVSCPNYECQQEAVDCSCDYTGTGDQCGITASNSSSCTPCPTEINIASDGSELYLYFCNPDETWEVVERNKKYDFTIEDSGVLNLRYKANSEICEGIRVLLSPNQGKVTMNVSPYPYFSYFGRNSPSTDTAYSFELNICPTDNQEFLSAGQWTKSTYFITIVAQSPMAQFSFEILSSEVSNSTIATSCPKVLNTHDCVVDGSLVQGEGADEEMHYYTYSVNTPQVVAFGFPSLQEDIDFFISDDPSKPFPNSLSNAKWDCSNERDDYLTLKLSPLPNGDPLVLYIGVSTFYRSNYSFTITTQGYNELISITDGSPQASAYNLVQTTRLLLPSGDSIGCNVWSRCNPFSVEYPFTQILPIWPLPSILSQDKRFYGITYEDNANQPQKNHYKAAYLLSIRQGNKKTVNADLSEIVNAKLQFLYKLVDQNGNALSGDFGYTLTNLTCNYDGFLNVTERLNKEEDTLFSTTDFIKLNSVVFKINTLTLTDEWVSCQNQASSLLNSNTTSVEKLTTFCPYSNSDPRFDLDPCCNSSLTFFHCCVPRLLSVDQTDFIGVREDLVNDQCSSSECTISVLDEYQNSLSSTSDCDVPGFLPDQTNIEMISILRECKGVLKSLPCNSDADCGTNGYTCDLFSRLCLIPAQQQDRSYLECVFESLPKPYVFSIIYKHQLNTTTNNGEDFIDKVFEAFKHEDCTYFTGQSYRTFYKYYSQFTEENRCYPYPKCMDLTCETVHDVCYDGNYGGWVTASVNYNDICEDQIGFCNTAPCNVDLSVQECKDQCEQAPDYCGYCSSNITDCFVFDQITSQATCENPNTNVCIFDNGYYDATIDEATCEQSGYCDKPCGYTCGGMAPTCIIREIIASENCNQPQMAWDIDYQVCVYTNATNEGECLVVTMPDLTTVWVNCSINPYDQCFSQGLDGWNVCAAEPIFCQSKEECDQAGECSDSYFFSKDLVSFYPEKHGKCVRGHFIWKTHWPIPTCNIDLEKDSPLGCYPYYFSPLDAAGYILDSYNITLAPLNEQECTDQGSEYYWWVPSKSKSECLSKQGCKILDNNYFNLPYNFRFNQMTEELCNSCGLDVFAQWENMFEWTPATWYPGISVKPQWMSPKFVFSTTRQNLTNYQYLYEELDDSVKTHIADLYRSESLCKMERVEDNLKSISCSCSGDGGSGCFSTSALVLGETKPCQGEESSYQFNNGKIIFTRDSITFACTSALISQISKQLYKSTAAQSLSSSFVSYRKPDNYGILNGKGAIIGTILSDGIKISSQGIQSLTLCFIETSEYSKQSKTYPVLDFALENTDTTELVPMELEIYHKTIRDNVTLTDVNYVCGDITNNSQSSINIFPVHRFDNWEDVNKEVFDKTARGLLYTLAVIFLITSLWGIIQMAVVLYRRKTLKEPLKLVHLLIIFVTLFITIRAIYFFILPSGSLSNNPVGDYILVVLPTFIYFTSFTIIVVLWYIIIKAKAKTRDLLKQVTYVVLIINIILYLLFMIIVLVFHFTEQDPQDDCGGRIIISVSSTTPQRVVSIVYAVIQAVISLVIGAAFIYLGGSLYLAMRVKRVSESSSTSDHHQKIFIITFACSVGFILHCVFVLILVGAEPSNVVFSFLGLILTEIIPSLSIFYSYNQGNLSGIKQTTKVSNLQYVNSGQESFNSQKQNSSFLNSSLSRDSQSSHSLNP